MALRNDSNEHCSIFLCLVGSNVTIVTVKCLLNLTRNKYDAKCRSRLRMMQHGTAVSVDTQSNHKPYKKVRNNRHSSILQVCFN